jgi:hypothetical protein
MVEWLTLVVSIVVLVIDIIVRREEFARAKEKARERQRDKKYIQEGWKFIHKITTLDLATRRSLRTFMVTFTFLVSVLSGSILGLVVDLTADTLTPILYGLIIFVVIFGALGLLVLISINSFDIGSYLVLLLSSIGLGLPWAAVTVGLSFITGFSLVYSGMFAAMIQFVSNHVLITKLSRVS